MALRLQFSRRSEGYSEGMFRLFALIVCSLPLLAQSWDPVRALPAGASVKVRETGGNEHKGTVSAVTPDAISIATKGAVVSVEKSRVSRVRVHSHSRRPRNIAIGAAVGLAVGLTIDQTVGTYLRNEGGESSAARAVTYIAPVGLFGALGASLSPYRTIYQVR
jgi:hypothetical protein